MKSLVKHLDATCLKTVMANSIVYFAIWHRLCCTFCIPFSLSFCLIIKRKQPTDLMEICLNNLLSKKRKDIHFFKNYFLLQIRFSHNRRTLKYKWTILLYSMSLAECQINLIDVNFHLQKCLETFDQNSADKIWSKKDKGWNCPPSCQLGSNRNSTVQKRHPVGVLNGLHLIEQAVSWTNAIYCARFFSGSIQIGLNLLHFIAFAHFCNS